MGVVCFVPCAGRRLAGEAVSAGTVRRLVASQYLDDGRWGLVSGDNEIIVGVTRHLAKEDARRLAACWNALDGLPTELIEKQGATRSGIYKGVEEISDKLAAARSLLVEVLAGDKQNMEVDLEINIREFLKEGAA